MAGASSSSSPSASPPPLAVPSDYYWLSPAYDPNMTLTVELRRILQAHNIPLGNSCTKVVMVKLFRDRIQAHRPALLASLTPATIPPEPQPQPESSGRPPRRRRRKHKTGSSASSSDDGSGRKGSRDHGDHDDAPAKDSSNKGKRMMQLEGDIECLMGQVVVGKENLEAAVDAAATLLVDYDDIYRQVRKVYKKIKGLKSLEKGKRKAAVV